MKTLIAILAFSVALSTFVEGNSDKISSVDHSWNKYHSQISMKTVQLNHIYLVVDKDTYESINRSDLINSLACTYEQKNSADNQIGWEGFYIRGKNTYVEIFYPQERYPKIGITGIAMGVDTKGALEQISEKLKKDHPNTKKGAFCRNGKPWFGYVAVNDSYFYERNSFWIMEYASEDFAENSEDVSRAHYNAKRYDPTKLLLDIDSVAIAFQPEGRAILSSYLKSLELEMHDHTYLTSENVEIALTEEDERRKGIYQISFSLNQHAQKGSYQIGNSLLVLQGKKAIWTFYTKSGL